MGVPIHGGADDAIDQTQDVPQVVGAEGILDGVVKIIDQDHRLGAVMGLQHRGQEQQGVGELRDGGGHAVHGLEPPFHRAVHPVRTQEL